MAGKPPTFQKSIPRGSQTQQRSNPRQIAARRGSLEIEFARRHIGSGRLSRYELWNLHLLVLKPRTHALSKRQRLKDSSPRTWRSLKFTSPKFFKQHVARDTLLILIKLLQKPLCPFFEFQSARETCHSPRACKDKEWIQVWTPPTSQDLSVCLYLPEDFLDSPPRPKELD